MEPRRPLAAALRALVAFGALLSCGPAPQAPAGPGTESGDGAAHFPAGTVLAVGDVPISEDDVLPVAAAIGLVEPSFTRPHRRRVALTEVLLPRAAVRAHHPSEREAARARAEAAYAALTGADEEARARVEAGCVAGRWGWRELGVDVWARLRDVPQGAWSEPLEAVGRFLVVRIDPASEPHDEAGDEAGDGAGTSGPAQPLSCCVLDFPYLPVEEADRKLQEAIDSSVLRILDPGWGELVPERWKYRMQRQSPGPRSSPRARTR